VFKAFALSNFSTKRELSCRFVRIASVFDWLWALPENKISTRNIWKTLLIIVFELIQTHEIIQINLSKLD
jgi:hypothetical protein